MLGSTEQPRTRNIGSQHYEQFAFAPNMERTEADYFGKQLHKKNKRKGLGFCDSAAMTIYLTTFPETST